MLTSVTVELDIRPGLPSFTMVGVGDRHSQAMREVVATYLLERGRDMPSERVTVNVSPESLRKLLPFDGIGAMVGSLIERQMISSEVAAITEGMGL